VPLTSDIVLEIIKSISDVAKNPRLGDGLLPNVLM
jgi:hypothetical protein